MRASDLLGRTVRDPAGRRRVVIGIRAVQQGPPWGGQAAIRVDAVVVSRRRTGAFLGYQQDEQRGPWALAALVRWWHRDSEVVPWDQVRDQLLAPPGRRGDA